VRDLLRIVPQRLRRWMTLSAVIWLSLLVITALTAPELHGGVLLFNGAMLLFLPFSGYNLLRLHYQASHPRNWVDQENGVCVPYAVTAWKVGTNPLGIVAGLDDMENWCRETCVGRYNFLSECVCFSNKRDAVLFKLYFE
jgi:hypothetical protein